MNDVTLLIKKERVHKRLLTDLRFNTYHKRYLTHANISAARYRSNLKGFNMYFRFGINCWSLYSYYRNCYEFFDRNIASLLTARKLQNTLSMNNQCIPIMILVGECDLGSDVDILSITHNKIRGNINK